MLDSPIRIGGRLAGVVCIEQERCKTFPMKREWSVAERNFASSLADFMAIALTSAEQRRLKNRQGELQKHILDLQGAVLRTVAELVEYRDTVTGGHVERTQFFLERLVDSLAVQGVYTEELSGLEINLFLMSSQLHDVGKIAIKDEILMKPGALTDEEFEQMKKHTVLGVEIINRINGKSPSTTFLEYAKVLAGTHHEKWDGTGYPYGLEGRNIPLMGRLMAIADVYDALTHDRPYKKAFSHEDAVDIIRRGAGTQFDPELIKVFLSCEESFKIFEAASPDGRDSSR
jgi:putative two-component system response regulator